MKKESSVLASNSSAARGILMSFLLEEALSAADCSKPEASRSPTEMHLSRNFKGWNLRSNLLASVGFAWNLLRVQHLLLHKFSWKADGMLFAINKVYFIKYAFLRVIK